MNFQWCIHVYTWSAPDQWTRKLTSNWTTGRPLVHNKTVWTNDWKPWQTLEYSHMLWGTWEEHIYIYIYICNIHMYNKLYIQYLNLQIHILKKSRSHIHHVPDVKYISHTNISAKRFCIFFKIGPRKASIRKWYCLVQGILNSVFCVIKSFYFLLFCGGSTGSDRSNCWFEPNSTHA